MKPGLLVSVLLFASFAHPQTQTTCKVQFAVVSKDALNNVKEGLSADNVKWYQKKLATKYPDVCYRDGTPPVVLFLSAVPATYHGTRTISSSHSAPINGTVHDSETGEEIGTVEATQQITTESTVPYSVDYKVLYLSIERKSADGKWTVAHNFQGKTLHPVLYGFCTRNCHPIHHLIEQAVKWIHEGGLDDPRQRVLAPN